MREQNIPVFHKERISTLPEPYVHTINAVMDIVVTINNIVKVILFGSCSRGTTNEKSDIDLLFLLDSGHSPYPQMEQNVGIMLSQAKTSFDFS